MATANDLLLDGLGRVHDTVRGVLSGLTVDELTARPAPDANTIAWLVWHLTRIEDDHIAGVAGSEQVWLADGWAERFGLPFDELATGYGQSSDEVAEVGVDADLLAGYQDAVHARAVEYVAGLAEDELARVVDRRWDPPVTLAVRLVSVLNDATQHAGQAAYVRGLLAR